MECCCHLRNIQEFVTNEKTSHERRFGERFVGPIVPNGVTVGSHPITASDKARLHQFGKGVLPAIFLGYARRHAGGWKRDILVADAEELQQHLLPEV